MSDQQSGLSSTATLVDQPTRSSSTAKVTKSFPALGGTMLGAGVLEGTYMMTINTPSGPQQAKSVNWGEMPIDRLLEKAKELTRPEKDGNDPVGQGEQQQQPRRPEVLPLVLISIGPSCILTHVEAIENMKFTPEEMAGNPELVRFVYSEPGDGGDGMRNLCYNGHLEFDVKEQPEDEDEDEDGEEDDGEDEEDEEDGEDEEDEEDMEDEEDEEDEKQKQENDGQPEMRFHLVTVEIDLSDGAEPESKDDSEPKAEN